jgi:hypothetical protein
MAETSAVFPGRNGACLCDRGFMNAVPRMPRAGTVDAGHRGTAAVAATEASAAAAERCFMETSSADVADK